MRMPGVNVRVSAIGVRIVAAMTGVSMPAKSTNRHSRESNSTECESGEIYVHWSLTPQLVRVCQTSTRTFNAKGCWAARNEEVLQLAARPWPGRQLVNDCPYWNGTKDPTCLKRYTASEREVKLKSFARILGIT